MAAKRQTTLLVKMLADGKQLFNTMKRAEQNTKKVGRAAKKANGQFAGLGRTIRGFTAAIATFYALSRAIGAVVRSVNELQSAANKLRVVTDSAAQLEEVQGKLFEVAQRSRISWVELQSVYQRFAVSTQAMGVAQSDLLRLVETVSKSAIVGGATTQELVGGLRQLTQGLASSRLSGDEMRSVLENLPVLAREVARALGITIGQFREWGKEGKLTTEVMVDGINKAQKNIEELFAKTQATLAQAWTQLGNSIHNLINEMLKLTGVADSLTEAIQGIAAAVDTFTSAIKDIGEAWRFFRGAFPTDNPLIQMFKGENLEFWHATSAAGPELLKDMLETRTELLRIIEHGIQAQERIRPGSTLFHEDRDEATKLRREIAIIKQHLADIANTPPIRIEIESEGGSPFTAAQQRLINELGPFTPAKMAEFTKLAKDNADELDKLLAKYLKTKTALDKLDGAFVKAAGNTIGFSKAQADAFRLEQENIRLLEEAEAKRLEIEEARERRLRALEEQLEKTRRKQEEFRQANEAVGRSLAEDLVDGLRRGASAMEMFANVVNRVLDRVLDVAVITPLGDYLGGLVNQGMGGLFPGLAGPTAMTHNQLGGRITRGGLSVVGERGPELVALPQGAQVFRNGAAAGGMGAPNLTINVDGVQDPVIVENAIIGAKEQIKREVYDSVIQQVKAPGVMRSLLGA